MYMENKNYPCAFLDCDFLSLDLIVIINNLFEARSVYNIPIFLSVQIYFKLILLIRFESMAPEQMTCTIVTHNRLYREIFGMSLGLCRTFNVYLLRLQSCDYLLCFFAFSNASVSIFNAHPCQKLKKRIKIAAGLQQRGCS